MSLTTRVSAFFLMALGLTLFGFSVLLYAMADHHLDRQLDERLEAALGTLEAAVDVEPGGLEWEPQERRLTLGLEPGVEQVRWSVAAEPGHLIDHSVNLALGANRFPSSWKPSSWPTTPTDGTVFGTSPGWRLAARRLVLQDLLQHGRGHPEDDEPDDDIEYPVLVITAGLSPAPVEASLKGLGLALAGLSTGLWLVAALLGRRLCRPALAPLGAMAASARNMTQAGHGEFLPSPGTRDEHEDLRVAFNELLARLHQAFDRQTRFTGDASHQLRTPLAGMLSLVEVTRRRTRPPEEYEQTLDQVHGETMRLSQIVESLLFLARTDADAELPKAEVVDLNAWLPGQLDRWRDHPRGSDLPEVTATYGPLPILAHPSLLTQVLENLLDNALKYSEPGTPILVKTWREPGAVLLAVEDQGHGLAEEELTQVFEPFYRSPRARRLGQAGVGLGLSMVQRITHAFGGSIDVQSTLGRGTRFVLRFPALHDLPPEPNLDRSVDAQKPFLAEPTAARTF